MHVRAGDQEFPEISLINRLSSEYNDQVYILSAKFSICYFDFMRSMITGPNVIHFPFHSVVLLLHRLLDCDVDFKTIFQLASCTDI